MSQEPITTYCPTCSKPFKVPLDLQGKKIVCKACQTHFVVQAGKPGIPAPPPAAPHAVAAAPAKVPPAPAAVASAKPASATGAALPVVAASSAPAPGPPPPQKDHLAPIPFDDGPAPVSADGAAPAEQMISTRGQKMEKVKIESTGPYFVVKLVLVGKMVHVGIEQTLNDHAADGWKLEQILNTGTEAYAILSRFHDGQTMPGAMPPSN